MNVAVAEFIRNLRYFCQLLSGNVTANYTKAKRKIVLLLLSHKTALFKGTVIYCHYNFLLKGFL